MNAQTVGWLVFLALIKNFSCGYKSNPFKLQDSHLTAKEGSCVEIKCTVNKPVNYPVAHWFWMKNYQWTREKDFTATIPYSTNISIRPVSADFADRVTYIGSPPSSWKEYSQKQCSILICDLTKRDSGNYSFRYVGNSEDKWVTDQVNLTVAENPCPITFEKLSAVMESEMIILKCSTLSSCPSKLLIQDLKGPPIQEPRREDGSKERKKSATVNFTAKWEDDGRMFSCQTHDNEDRHLIRNVSATVKYAPKDTVAKISPDTIKEGQLVTFTCSAKGNPKPSFTWFYTQKTVMKAEWEITSIKDSQSGEYHCEAHNTHGTQNSNTVTIDVTYGPQVEVKMTAPASSSSTQAVVKQGDKMTLTCNVKRSNPQPHTYDWFKDGKAIGQGQTHVVESIEPENNGTYKCTATNTVDTGTSELYIVVEYSPRKTNITKYDEVKVGKSLMFYCNTDAYPPPKKYSWYRYNKNKQNDSSLLWKSKTTEKNCLHLETVQRADEACYMCNATNRIDTGETSKEMCIQVLYPPTKPTLSMDGSNDMPTVVTEDQRITIKCTVDSFPPSRLTLKRTSTSHPQLLELAFSPHNDLPPNTLRHSFNVTSTHTGIYTCNAQNSEGSEESIQRKLVVKYRPKGVTVKVHPDLVVNENQMLTLRCLAQSFPPVTSVRWMKMTEEGKSEIIHTWNITVNSVSPSDSGKYSCEAGNEIGTEKSQPAEVNVKYAPKHTKITIGAEQQQSDGMSSVVLSCSSRCYPPVRQYTWYKKDEESDIKVHQHQNYTVCSDEPGVYYCIAENEINQMSSEPVPLFVNRRLMKTLKIFIPLLIILLIVFIVLVYRHKRNKSRQQGTTRTLPCFGFLGRWNGPRGRNRINEPIMAEPFRSRDDLLPDQPCRPNGQRRQSHPDSTPAANIGSVYCTVNLPAGKQGPSAQKPIRQQGGHTGEDSLNYASLHFGNKQKNKQAKVEQDVYAMVSKQKSPKKREQERMEDYENISTARAAKPQDPLDSDTDTSEDEAELNYSQVNFTAKPGHQRDSTDSSTSDEEETQYSEVKL